MLRTKRVARVILIGCLVSLMILVFGCKRSQHYDNFDYDYDETVYVSNYGKIHSDSSCSGMKYYEEMEYEEAIAEGYDLCQKCYG